ncbi:MAG TPA: NADH-quinone oxidoreductase subunit J [Dehalococcoidia bacterium]|nr:NADH-quinone oxidoreductase subunit J [Dehalococcoidia bacterium]
MTLEEGIFYVVAAVTALGGLGVVLARNVVYAALFLIVALLGVAGIFLLLAAEFLAIVQVLIYGAAVTILVLFVLMLTRARDVPQRVDSPQRPLAFLLASALLGLLVTAIVTTDWAALGASEQIHLVPAQELGRSLFRNWSVPFEVASLVLIVALVGAVILARVEEGEE